MRQILNQGGFYDIKDKDKHFKTIINSDYIFAMCPPGGGRTYITPRIIRQLSLISIAIFDNENL